MAKVETISDITDAWVKLYDDKEFKDTKLEIKYPENVPDMKNKKGGFNDKASSVKYLIPVGYKFTLYDDKNYKDSPYPLNGTGQVVEIKDLGSFNDKCSSGKWGESSEGDSDTISDITDAWVKLYEDKEFKDTKLEIKYPDNVPDMENKKGGFNDKASSVKYLIPVGYKFTLYDDKNYKDSPYPLNGTGQVVEIKDLGSFNDKCSSGKWGESSEGDSQADTIQLHAKTYYDNPAYQGQGDEHYVTVPVPGSFETENVSYRGIGWETMISGTVYNDAGPVGGSLRVNVQIGDCIGTDMEGAILTLSCSIGYWISPPTGYQSVSWSAQLSNSEWEVTEVTN